MDQRRSDKQKIVGAFQLGNIAGLHLEFSSDYNAAPHANVFIPNDHGLPFTAVCRYYSGTKFGKVTKAVPDVMDRNRRQLQNSRISRDQLGAALCLKCIMRTSTIDYLGLAQSVS